MEHAFLDGKPLATDGIDADAQVSTLVERAKTSLEGSDSMLLEVMAKRKSSTFSLVILINLITYSQLFAVAKARRLQVALYILFTLYN